MLLSQPLSSESAAFLSRYSPSTKPKSVSLSHKETPGLGGRIIEPEFRERFVGGDVSRPDAEGRYIIIGGGKPPETDPSHNRHVDAITGATGTSRALGKFINRDIARFHRAMAHAGLAPADTSTKPERERGER